MTNEEALVKVRGYLTDYLPLDSADEIDEIIKALEQQTCEDCTSEEEVTDIILSIARNLEHICEVIKNDKKRGYKLS